MVGILHAITILADLRQSLTLRLIYVRQSLTQREVRPPVRQSERTEWMGEQKP